MKWTSSEECTYNDHTVSGDTAKCPNQSCQQAHINEGIVECSGSCFRHFNKWKTVSGQWLVWAPKKFGWRGVDVLRLVLTPWIHRRIEDSFVRLDELIDDAYPYSHLHHDRRKKQQRQRNDVDIHPSSPIIWARHFEQQKRDRQVFRSNYQILNN